MKKRMIVLCLAFLLLFSGCSFFKQKPTNDFTDLSQTKAVLYFSNKDGTDLIAVDLNVEGKQREELPRFIMESLLSGPTSTELSQPIRTGTRLLSVSAYDGMAIVDLSKEFYHEESIYDVLATASVVKSLCSIKGISQVMMLIEGKSLQNASGEEMGVLKETDVVFDADALMQDESNITLYFSDANAEALVREIRRVKVTRGDSMEKLVVAELIDGPKNQGAVQTVPKETKILSIETKDAVCFVNLTSDFIPKNTMGTAVERMVIYSIVNSLTELSNVEKVQFLIEGEKREVYHHMIFNEPIARDISMIQK
ncbi:MAG: hypothetical protein E7418_00655 [Ruminococcaceae bacterium]|nr:hypothetical protein [Oscillospiraceae bacterium]